MESMIHLICCTTNLHMYGSAVESHVVEQNDREIKLNEVTIFSIVCINFKILCVYILFL